MYDDLRTHEATPSPEEREWMETNVVEVLARSLALAAIAVVIGVSASIAVGYPDGIAASGMSAAR